MPQNPPAAPGRDQCHLHARECDGGRPQRGARARATLGACGVDQGPRRPLPPAAAPPPRQRPGHDDDRRPRPRGQRAPERRQVPPGESQHADGRRRRRRPGGRVPRRQGLHRLMIDGFSEEEVARYWDANAASWAEQVRGGGDVAREWLNNPAFLQFLGDLRGREVLDAGCGEGYNTRMLALAVQAERREPLGIRYTRTSYAELGVFADASFDGVVSFMALMDGPGFDRAMQEVFRVLRPGGLLAFSITHPCFLTKGAKWVRNEEGVKIKWMVGDYFDSTGWVERWRFTDAPPEAPEFVVPRFDRTLSEYVNGIIAAGFVLKRIEEPRPSEEYCQAHPSQRGWRDHAGLFLYCRAEKPT